MATFEDVYNNLKTQMQNFRRELLRHLITYRIQKELNAINDGVSDAVALVKWGTSPNFNYIPMNYYRYKAYGKPLTALKIGNQLRPVESSDMPQITAKWVGDNVDYYPIGVDTWNDPEGKKQLPIVSEITFDPNTTQYVLRQLPSHISRTFVVVKVSHDTFNDPPDFSDADYDYYIFDEEYSANNVYWLFYNYDNPTETYWYEKISLLEAGAFVTQQTGKMIFKEAFGTWVVAVFQIDGSDLRVHMLTDAEAKVEVEGQERTMTVPLLVKFVNNLGKIVHVSIGDLLQVKVSTGESDVYALLPNYTTYSSLLSIASDFYPL